MIICRKALLSVLRGTRGVAVHRQPRVTPMAAPELDHKSAVAFVPPREFWNNPIQEIRCFHDRAFVRWPPHINLLYPFWNDSGDNFREAAAKLRQCVETVEPFRIKFDRFRFFSHGNSCTVWLQPESDALIELQHRLSSAFPECYHLSHDPSRDIEAFTPHLSVGQWPTPQLAEEAITRLSLSFQPIEIPFEDIVILHRQGYQTPFEFKYKIPLGAASDDAIEEVNTSYVASLGSSAEMCRTHPYGIAAYAQGVWNFAYGANVNQHKLVVGRQITPLESLPAVLEGYKLCFNHHGGMGNVECMTASAATYFESRGIRGVHGVLHRLSYTDFARLTNMESGYRPVEVDAQALDGKGRIKAVVFQSPPHRNIRDGLPPPDRYVNLILSGLREWNLSPEYIRWLESVESIPFKNRGPLYWRTPEGQRIQDRIMRVGGDPPSRNPPTRYN